MRVYFGLRSAIASALCACSLVTAAFGQVPGQPVPGQPVPGQPGYGAAPGTAPGGVPYTARVTAPGVQAPANPLQSAVDWAEMSLAACHQIRDYTFTFVKREQINGKLTDYEAMAMKIRQQPFSLYIYTLGPTQPKGQEVIYVEGRNNGKVLAHVTGFRHKLIGMIALDPSAPELLEGNRHGPTSAGMRNMLTSLLAGYGEAMKGGETAVRVIPGAKVDNRNCTCVEVTALQQLPNHSMKMTRIFYDDETRLPIRFEAYGWPTQAGGQLPLVEEYTYRDVRLNVGLTDADFDPNNPAYGFK